MAISSQSSVHKKIKGMCSRCKAVQARAGQRYCKQCHRLESKELRLKRVKAQAELLKVLDSLTGHCQSTEKHFAAKSKSKHVVVVGSQSAPITAYAGYVTAYFPEDWLQIMDEHGEVHRVKLEHVIENKLK